MDLKNRILAVPHQHQLRRFAAEDLPAELGADGAARAGDEHALAPQHAAHRADVGAHRLAAQQVLDPHLAQLVNADAAVQQLVDAGDDARLHPCLAADAHDVTDLGAGRGGHGDDDLADLVGGDHLRDGVAVAQHRHAVDLHVVLAQVVVQEADRLQAQVGVVAQLTDDHGAGVARAHDKDGLWLCTMLLAVGSFPQG